MKTQTVELDMEAFGAQFANMGDDDQALFFKGLAGELKCWESAYAAQIQFHSVGRKLKPEQKKLLAQTVAMVWHEED